MKSRKVTIYSCDFCKKKLQRVKAMEKHELACIHNPDRCCEFCEFHKQRSDDVLHRRTLRTLIVVLQSLGIDRLKAEANCCPGCILAAIVQSRKQQRDTSDDLYNVDFKEGFIDSDKYDFAAEKLKFFEEFNRIDSDEYRSLVGGYGGF